ncbi:histidine triad (HIT) protein [Candidatus Protofrankia datiscae]|uniref:Histidine triad (HIT) protein n=2 Tax=Protofrankia TaxID=2994361 RepID=F8AYG9_9ACTN|nr:histidine triad (HIT) protein [Candidatus Protofrankia datiscae]
MYCPGMASVFTRIIKRELPGRIVHEDDHSAAFLTIAPIRPGHTLVVPRLEVDHWIDLPPDVLRELWSTAALVGRAIDTAFRPRRVAALLAGLEVPHVHVHLIPIDSEADISFEAADHNPDPAALDDAAERIRAALAR